MVQERKVWRASELGALCLNVKSRCRRCNGKEYRIVEPVRIGTHVIAGRYCAKCVPEGTEIR
jgi:late competence protein required for DNA uptake (superfamily II DNA/RNA helicase)